MSNMLRPVMITAGGTGGAMFLAVSLCTIFWPHVDIG